MRTRRRQRAPLSLAVPAGLGVLFLVVPVVGLMARAPWSSLLDDLAGDEVVSALGLSLVTATAATTISVVLGVPLAWLLARVEFPGRSLLRALVVLPLVLPPVVGGVALLLVFGRSGPIGRALESTIGVVLPFSTAGVVLAATFVAMPFLILTVEGALRASGSDHEDVAATLGAGPLTTFGRVTLPLLAPAIGAGAVLCWARALGEFGATITFAGSFPGETETVPLAVYLFLQSDPDAAVALSVVLLAISLVVLIGLRNRWLPLR